MNDTATRAAQAATAAGWGSDAVAELLRALELPQVIMSVTLLLVVFAASVNGILLAIDRRLHFRT